MKIEKAELEFIRDKFGNKYTTSRVGVTGVTGCHTLEDVRAWLIEHDKLKPDPLEEALVALDKVAVVMTGIGWRGDTVSAQIMPEKVRPLLRKFAADLTE